MESARLATAADLSSIEAISKRHRAEMASQRGGEMYLLREAGAEAVTERAARSIASDNSIMVVGSYDEVVFGFALVDVELLVDGSRLANLDQFIVDSEARQSGIGEAMMNLVLELAEQAGCVGVDSRALPGDRETKNFFESFGLKARMLVVHRSLR